MTTDNQPQVPASTPSPDAWLTTGTLTLIGIAIVLAIVLICWGAHLKRQRKASEREMLERQEDRHDGGTATPPAAAPRAETATPPPSAAGPGTGTLTPPPVAPAPPPLESSDTPVPAAAPLDASPATIAEEAHADTPASADDLTLLKGVGPKLAARLGELGITRFAQLAALAPGEADALDAQLGSFQGRMARDRWIDQARYLAANDRAGFEAEFGKL